MAPIIDVHTHLFSALDIPMEGYLLSRRIEKRRPCELEYIINFFPGPQLFHYLVDRMRDRCITRQLNDNTMGWFYSLMLRIFGKYMAQDLKNWEDSLSQTVRANAVELAHLWDNIDLFVPLIVDYEYWFKNTIDVPLHEQVALIFREVILPFKGRFHGFVPFDPARELAFRHGLNNPDGQVESIGSLDLVKQAIETMGFLGVKLYNTIGYKPFENDDDLTSLYRQRIAARNDKGAYLFEGKAYDQVLSELYAYCEKNEIPVIAHCMPNGIEAYPGASMHFGAARFWEPVLNAYPRLKINLAHFGWNPMPGRGYGHPDNWMRSICSMMAEHENLYTDISHHDVLSRFNRPDFIQAYRKMKQEFSGMTTHFRKRILYGSDWHVLRRIKQYPVFPERYREVMISSGFYQENEMDDFLGNNAMSFLGLWPGGRNRKRLESFYRRHHLPFPEWHQKTQN